MMQRILYCTDLLIAGGIERQTIELITRLDREHFDPHLICLYAENAGYRLHFAPQLHTANIPLYVLNLGWTPIDKLRGVIEIIRLTWRIRPHILHATNYHSNLLTRLARPFLPPRLNLIGSVRGTYSPKQLLYERLSYCLCVRIATNGPHLRKQLLEHAHLPANKVIYIPNGVDTDKFTKNPDPLWRDKVAPNARRVFVSVGRISTEKPMHLIPEALGILKRQGRLEETTRVCIVGLSQTPVMQALLDQAIALNELQAIVFCFPETSQPEAYYHAADAVILFSPAEGMPNVALESLAAGRPVIISEAANAAGIIEHGKTGWIVRTGDVEHLADTLGLVLELPTKTLKEMNADCMRRAGDFSMESMVESYQELYSTL